MVHFVTSLSELVIKVEIYITNGVEVTDGRDGNQDKPKMWPEIPFSGDMYKLLFIQHNSLFCAKLIDLI